MNWSIIKEITIFTGFDKMSVEYEFVKSIVGTERQASAYCATLERKDVLSKYPDMQKGEDGVWSYPYPFTRVRYEFTDELEDLFNEYKQLGFVVRNEGITLNGTYTKEQLQDILKDMK